MPEYQSISKQKPKFPNYLDFQSLRDIGIKHLQFLSGKLWTDYNLHDPGVTILEVLCYAITDLGYRNNLDIKDLLALNPEDTHSRENNFFTPDQVLTCNPVTELDLRKRLIDVPGVRNAWLKKVEQDYQPNIYVDCQNSRLQYIPPVEQPPDEVLNLAPRGIYSVYLDLELPHFQERVSSLDRYRVLEEVKKVLCSYRNLCEDFQNIVVLEEEKIALCSDIELEKDADPEDVLVEIYLRTQEFLAPRLQFYTLQELLTRGKKTSEIFAGRPSSFRNDTSINYESHGFIDTAELEKLTQPEFINTSDLYRVIGKVPGVAAIKKLSIAKYINGELRAELWRLPLTKDCRPVLAIDITFFKGELPFRADPDEVKQRYYDQQAAYIKAPLEKHELDLAVPQGNYYNLADHYSIHHDFPLTYGIGEDGLPRTASAQRQAQALQLKGYLLFFDQLLANYLAQLAHVRDLFSWESDDKRSQSLQRTYFGQTLDFPGVEKIVNVENSNGAEPLNMEDFKQEYQKIIDKVTEDDSTYQERRNRFLDHLLARFAESFTDYVLLNYQIKEGRRPESKIINDKARFLQEYPSLSRDRFRALNYCNCQKVWNTDNVAGFKKRVCRLLGIENLNRRSLSPYEIIPKDSGYIFLIDYDSSGLSLKSKQIYGTEEEAQAALEEFLPFAFNPNYYKRLCYHYFYCYGWEVVDRAGQALVSYQKYFLTPAERKNSLEPLLQDLSERLAELTESTADSREESEGVEVTSVSLEDFIRIEQNGESYFKFWLEIPSARQETREAITFKGLQTYDTEAKAEEAANISLQQIRVKQYYRASRLGAEDNDVVQNCARYGYAVVDTEGKVWAETSKYWVTQEDRNEALQSWLRLVPTNQNANELTVGTFTYHLNKIESQFKIELAQERENVRLIDYEDDEQPAFYGWELTNKAKDQTLAIYYDKTSQEREDSIEALQAGINDEGFHLVEHILLRPRQSMMPANSDEESSSEATIEPSLTESDPQDMAPSPDEPQLLPISLQSSDCLEKPAPCLASYDPYSFWVSIILPYWPVRFRDRNFRRLVERTLRLEAPAHVALRICWIDVSQMHQFETAYKEWLRELAHHGGPWVTYPDSAIDLTKAPRTEALNDLLAILTELKNVYPEGTLHDCEESDPEDNPIILNQTNLGTAND